MGDDDAALLRLWREKRGEAEPVDLSGNLIVQLGAVTEELNRRWYEANTGQFITDVQKHIRHPGLRWMGATLDGRVEASGAVFEAKFMLPWSFSEEPLPRSICRSCSRYFGRKILADRATKEQVNSDNARLKSQLSAVLCDQLLGELKEVNSVDAAAIWARRILPAKNSLNVADARQLENAFQAKLAALELRVDNAEPQPSPFGSIRNPATSLKRKGPELTGTSTIERIEKKRSCPC